VRIVHERGAAPQTPQSDLNHTPGRIIRQGTPAQRIAGARRRLDYALTRLLLIRPPHKRAAELIALALAAFDQAVDIAKGDR